MRCTKCRLHKTCNHPYIQPEIVGRGNHVVFLGEAPGADEDQANHPFIGRSGQLLRHAIRLMGLEDYTLANVVNCRPPDNRKPTAAEQKACRSYLDDLLQRLKPKIIVPLGATAVRALAGRAIPMHEARTMQFWRYNGAIVLATYHPAYILREPSNLSEWKQDLNRIIDCDSPDYQQIKPEIVVVEHVDKLQKAIAFDIETTGLDPLDPWSTDARIVCVTWSNSITKGYYTENIESFVHAFSRDRPKLIGHNVKFDLLWLNRFYKLELGTVYDTQVMSHLIWEERPSHGLKYLAGMMSKLGNYSFRVTDAVKQGKITEVAEEDRIQYAGYDAVATWTIYKIMKPELVKLGLWHYFKFRMSLLKVLLDMELKGMPIDPDAAYRRADEIKAAEKELVDTLDMMAISTTDRKVNWNSSQDLGEYLLQCGFELPLTKRGNPKTDKTVIERLTTTPKTTPINVYYLPLIQKALLQLRALSKLRSTYFQPLQELARPTKNYYIIHPTFSQTRTVTGRLSCSNPNLQNIPRSGISPVKEVFVAPDGYTLIQADYSQIELRIGALIANEQNMLKLFQLGADLHTETAKQLFKTTKITKDQRNLAKTINFGIFYGAGSKRIADEGRVSHEHARELITTWFRTYPAIHDYMLRVEKELKEVGYVTNLFGRRRNLPVVSRVDPDIYMHIMRQAVNFPVQSTAADLTFMALCKLHTLLKLHIPSAHICLTVHDSVICMTKEADAYHVAALLKTTMENGQDLITEYVPAHIYKATDFRVETPVELVSGQCWGKMTPLEANHE